MESVYFVFPMSDCFYWPLKYRHLQIGYYHYTLVYSAILVWGPHATPLWQKTRDCQEQSCVSRCMTNRWNLGHPGIWHLDLQETDSCVALRSPKEKHYYNAKAVYRGKNGDPLIISRGVYTISNVTKLGEKVRRWIHCGCAETCFNNVFWLFLAFLLFLCLPCLCSTFKI